MGDTQRRDCRSVIQGVSTLRYTVWLNPGRKKKGSDSVLTSACSDSLGVTAPLRGVEQLSKAPRLKAVRFEAMAPLRATLRLGHAV